MSHNNKEFDLQTSKIEKLLSEFYSDYSTNDRKKQIESELSIIKNSAHLLSFFVYDLENVDNKFVWFFRISCLENVIIRDLIDVNNQKSVEHILWTVYTNIPVDATKLQRDKIAQLLIHLFMKNKDEDKFLDELTKLINNKFLFGVILLKTLSEEIFSTRSNINAQLKEFLRQGLIIKLKPICKILQNYVLFLCDYINSNNLDIKNEIFNETTIECLFCIQHLFTWINLDHLINEDFLNQLFRLATLRFTHHHDTSFTALTTICELFYRQIALPLPPQTVNNIIGILDESNLIINDSSYLEKLTELLVLFASQPFSKWIDEETFQHFLYKIYNFTTNSKFCCDGTDFSNKLLIWKTLVKIHMIKDFEKYEHIILELILYIFKSQLLFTKSSNTQFLDNQNLDDDMKTDWQRFTEPCFELILLVTKKKPCNMVKILLEFWNHFLDVLYKMKSSDEHEKGQQLNTIWGAKVLRNISTLCQLLSALPSVLDDSYPIDLYFNLLHQFNNSIQLFCHIRTIICKEYEIEADNLLGIFLSSIKCFIPLWEKHSHLQDNSIHNFLNISIHFIVEKWNEPKLVQYEAAQLLLLISATVRKKCVLENDAVKSLLNFTYDMNYLKLRDTNKKSHDEFVPISVFKSLCNILLLPWSNVPETEQMHENRNYLFQIFMNRLTNDVVTVEIQIENSENVYLSYIKCLPILTDILNYFRDTTNAIKLKLVKVYQPVIIKSISVLSIFNNITPLVFECILDFIKVVLKTLQNQLPTAFITGLLEVILSETLKLQSPQHKFNSIEKILQMFIYIVERPGNSSKTLYPFAIRFVLDHVLPIIKDGQPVKCMDNVVVSMFLLLDCILQNKWNHFFPNIIQTKPNFAQLNTVNQQLEVIKFEQDFLNIFFAYGYGLMSWNDPEVKRIILNSMETLNDKNKLFSREYFQKNLLLNFLDAFLKLILQAEGSLHYDILLHLIFSMGQGNSSYLLKAFTDYGYPENSSFVQNIVLSTDLPTFTEHMNKLVYDTKLYSNFN